MKHLFSPCAKYDLDQIATIADYKPTYSLGGRMVMVVAPDNTQYDFLLYPFASGDAWVLVAVDGELPSTPDIDALADLLLSLNGMQQCDLAVALVRRNPRLADELSTTIGDAVGAAMIAAGETDDW